MTIGSEAEATTSNYFQVALSDDRQAEEVQGAIQQAESSTKAEKAEIRRQRIEAAVQRSKGEYKAEHAYTERDWFINSEIQRNVLSKPKVDKQHLEYITTSLYYASPLKYREALDLILKGFDPSPISKKALGGLTRESLDLALRCALRLEDEGVSLQLAKSSRNLWKGQFAGIAILASDAYILANRHRDALTPLLVSTSSFGLHAPILSKISEILQHRLLSERAQGNKSNANGEGESGFESTKYFLLILERVIIWKSTYLQKPLFDDSKSDSLSQDAASGPDARLHPQAETQISVETPRTKSTTTSSSTSPATSTSTSASMPATTTATAKPYKSLDIDIDISFDRPIDIPSIIRELSLDPTDKELISGLNGTVARLNKGLKSDDGGHLDADAEGEVVEKSVREL
ncbi:uncharacterized protein I303_100254 [Kwoniella dejecticola CBS 10117]|uniref:Uncharacterized protein n=1 Tax=Kwoniella dejecticola CBS 10117 TaxID=1296121 RepID=A0A1A6AEG8_9TREE|nr:uncharacterized protein I303_00256 [Kwoniella dejecticola CBS 10117]OBR88439.1 hypothetical protein I303_00256 [Kwoniella dejecticola CBS 10117]